MHAVGTLTIAAGAITLPAISTEVAIIHAVIDTEAGAASDDLDQIDITGTVTAGTILILRPVTALRDVVVRSTGGGTGNLRLAGAASATLGATTHAIMVYRFSTFWAELSRQV